MTDPVDNNDLTVGLRQLSAAAAQQAQPPTATVIRQRARHRRLRQVMGAAAAITLVAVGGGVALANSGLTNDRTGGPAGPDTSTHTSAPAPTSTTTYGTERYDAIPADYPMLSLVDDPGGDGTTDGPAETVPELPISPCGQRVWNPDAVIDQLAVRSNIPENTQVRQIVLFDDQEAAQQAINTVRGAFESCPIETFEGSPYESRHDVATPDLEGWQGTGISDDALSVSTRITYQGDPAIGLTELRWLRIDNAVFYTFETSEAMSDATQPGHAANQLTRQMVLAWCDRVDC